MMFADDIDLLRKIISVRLDVHALFQVFDLISVQICGRILFPNALPPTYIVKIILANFLYNYLQYESMELTNLQS